ASAAGIAARPDLPTRSSRPLDVLLVEDNPINQKVMARMLEKAGHQVTVAGEGSQAVAAVRDVAFDIIFMDLQMPGMDGFEATRRIREQAGRGAGPTPIVALTAHAMNIH